MDAENNIKGRGKKLGDKLRNLPADQKFGLSHIFTGLETFYRINHGEIIDDVPEYIRTDEIPDDFRDPSFFGNDRYYRLEHIKEQYAPTLGQIVGAGVVLNKLSISLFCRMLATPADLKPPNIFFDPGYQKKIADGLMLIRDKVKDKFELDITTYKEVIEGLINRLKKLKDELKETNDPSAYSAKLTETINKLEAETKKYNAKFRISSRILVRLHNWIGNEDKPGGAVAEKFKELKIN